MHLKACEPIDHTYRKDVSVIEADVEGSNSASLRGEGDG